MKKQQIKTRVTKAFEDGKLIPAEEQTTDISRTAVSFPEEVATGTISIGRDFPMMVYGFGGNAKASVHVSVPFQLEESEIEDAVKYATDLCEKELVKQKTAYIKWLDSLNVDWKKVEKAMK